jgi:hypothetical protein
MSIGAFLAGLWFILIGVDFLAWVNIDIKLIGLLAFIVGIIWLVDCFHPLTIKRS